MLHDKVWDYINANQKYIDELFGPNELFLDSNDFTLLDEYIKDCNNPIWKDIYINGKITNYEISNIGEIRNKLNGNIKAKYGKDRYYNMQLYVDGKCRHFLMHRLVAIHFLDENKDKNKPCVNHINGNRYCNWYKNLEWVSNKSNTQHAIENGLWNPKHGNQAKGSSCGASKHTEKDAHSVCYLITKGLSNTEIMNKTKYSYDFIRSIRECKAWIHISKNYGIKWK